MSPEQEKHLQLIKDSFVVMVDRKYKRGAEIHGGDLQKKNLIALLDDALDEAIDQVVYLLTARDKASEMLAGARSAE